MATRPPSKRPAPPANADDVRVVAVGASVTHSPGPPVTLVFRRMTRWFNVVPLVKEAFLYCVITAPAEKMLPLVLMAFWLFGWAACYWAFGHARVRVDEVSPRLLVGGQSSAAGNFHDRQTVLCGLVL